MKRLLLLLLLQLNFPLNLSDCLSGSAVVEEGGKRPESGTGRADQARERAGEQQVKEEKKIGQKTRML